MADLNRLIEEFAAEFEAGNSPDPGDWLERASTDQRQELAGRLDAYLMEAPRRRWDAAAYEASPAKQAVERVFQSMRGVSGTWPQLLPHLRHRARMKRRELVHRLAEALGVADREEKVAAYYNRMEHGLLPARGVSGRVIEALAGILGVAAEEIRAAGERTRGAIDQEGAPAYARLATPEPEYVDALADPQEATPEAAEEAWDEVDRLFRGG